MAKLRVPYTRRSGFSGSKSYRSYIERLKNSCNAVDGSFSKAIGGEKCLNQKFLKYFPIISDRGAISLPGVLNN
jgi:hypothetical protein